MLIKLFSQKEQNPELIKVYGEQMIDFILMSI